jgi:tetratricopeptide (TPR) repeat protein
MAEELNWQSRVRQFLEREPVKLALLAGLAVVLFVTVTGISRLYQEQQQSLGSRWFSRGVADLNAGQFDRAVIEFRAALVYSRDNYDYQLNLAESLVGLKRTGEAYAYLINLWDRQPEDGVVNLELARIAAERGQSEQAQRYYHNAIYATWPGDAASSANERRDARQELIEYLLKINARPQAQAELMALTANLRDDPGEQMKLGSLYLRAQDYEHALSAFREALKGEHHDAAALAGAGRAAFELARYDMAEKYLRDAVAANAADSESADRLRTTELVLRLDPFRTEISAAQRNRAVLDAFAAAGERLKSCAAADGGAVPTESQTSLADSWEKMKPKVTATGLERNPDLASAAMGVVFEVEQQTSATCGMPAGSDLALLLIAKLHEGN